MVKTAFYNTTKFYNNHPDMAPKGNPLLWENRVTTIKEIDKYLDYMIKENKKQIKFENIKLKIINVKDKLWQIVKKK